MREARIQVRDMVVRFGDNLVLDRVGFDVFRGEILVVLGGSGCGKSTLLRHVTGLATPESGTVLIDGVDITRCGDKDFHRILRKFGVLFQSSGLFGSMTVAENLAVPILEYTGLDEEAACELIRMKLRQVNLQGFENHMPHEISGGMKKRAGLARALALNPEILFLDEPTAGLDPVTAAEIDELILRINRYNHMTMVIVTHELSSIFAVAHRIIMLDKAARGVIAEGDPAYLKDHSPDERVRNFFNRKANTA